jgi:hypothetical protein
MTTMIYLYTRYFFDRAKREAFEKLKGERRTRKMTIA